MWIRALIDRIYCLKLNPTVIYDRMKLVISIMVPHRDSPAIEESPLACKHGSHNKANNIQNQTHTPDK